METELIEQWYEVGETNVYTTGHYVVEKYEVKAIFQSETLDNGENLRNIENNQMITTRLASDRRILFYFFPLRTQSKYLMDGNASKIALEEIEDILPEALKKLLVENRRVQYK